MAFSPASPVTGAAISGFTSPTMTLALDIAPTPYGRQYAISALGGTQTGASPNSPTLPYTVTMVRPTMLKSIAPIKTGSNQLTANNRNIWKMVFRKGAVLNANGTIGIAISHIDWDLPAGMEAFAAAELKTLISFQIGILWSNAQGIYDTLATGVM